MPATKTPTKNASWSRTLRDSDNDSCDDAAPPPRSSRQTRTRTTSSDADGFTWGAGTDTVDIGLVSEPAGLKFVETPFTLAKRTDARRDNGVRRGGKGGRSGGKVQQPHSSSPPHIRTDSPSPELPSFQAPLLRPKAVRPAKPFVSPVRSVKQLPPHVKPASAPLAAPAAPATVRSTVLPVFHDTPRKKPRISQAVPSLASEAGPSQVVATPIRSLPVSTSKTRLVRFRHIGTFSSTGQSPPPVSPAHPSAVSSSAKAPPVSASSPHKCSASFASSSTSSVHQPSTSASASSSTATTPSASSSTFRLSGLAPDSASSSTSDSASRPAGRLAFSPAESLAAFRARVAGAVSAPSPSSSTSAAGTASCGRKRARDAASAEDGGGRERVVLGTAVRSVRPVSLASIGGSGRPRGAGLGRSVGPRATPRREGAQEGGESAEARLRRLYSSLEG
ncbi:hypothetical protein JCM10450v2_006963 [Rhodotorula kratochvilovae]